ncbi:MAG TPA: DUF296 domain-containing protein [Rhabdaerophilum sp.]|nr:DUF296 domain-containing protein [Rhabdaerophilum sp.]
MTRPAFIRQPGPTPEPRLLAAEGRGQPFRFILEPGLLLVEAMRRGFQAAGFASGTASLRDVAFGPFTYVMPALSKDETHAAFYSEFFRPAGITRMQGGALSFGMRDGAAFFHCHGLWREADERECGGHVIPEETVVAEPIEVEAFGIAGARFEVMPDPETNFRIFHPTPTAEPGKGARAFVIRLRPNQDFCGALEQFCLARGIRRARLHGGVGSTIGAHLTDGTVFENFATEVYVEEGVIETGAGGHLAAAIDIGLIDHTGRIARGQLVRGDNPVLMTFELVIEVLEGA